MKNERYADGPLYNATLTDTLRDPAGKVLTKRSWPLDAVVAGDLITLTYDVSYAATSTPGVYTNEAIVTGDRMIADKLRPMRTPIKASTSVSLVQGMVLGASTGTGTCAPLLSQSMGAGQRNDPAEVMKLQQFLAKDPAVYPQGLTTGLYGPLTSAAVKRFQEKYAADILAPLGLTAGTGFAGPSTIKKINELNCASQGQTLSSAGASASMNGLASTPSPAPNPVPAPTPSNNSGQTGSAPAAPSKPKSPTTAAKGPPVLKNKLLDAASSFFPKLW